MSKIVTKKIASQKITTEKILVSKVIFGEISAIRDLLSVPLLSNLFDTSPNNVPFSFVRDTKATYYDFEGLQRTARAGQARFEGTRRVYNMATLPEQPATQNIIIEVGKKYQVQIGANSTVGATITFSNGFSAVLTADGTNIISLPNGIPKTATNTVVTCTIVGDIKNFQVEDVTGQTNQNPSEFTLNQWQGDLKFDGTSYISSPNTPTLEALDDNFDIELSFIMTTDNSGRRLISKRAGSLGFGLRFQSGQLVMYLNDGVLTFSKVFTSFTFQENIEYRVKFEKAGENLSMYVDNIFKETHVLTGIGSISNTAPVLIGRYSTNFIGYIKDVVLTNNDISSVALNIPINEQEGDIAYDTSGNNNDGSIIFDLFPKYYETLPHITVDGSGIATVGIEVNIADYIKKGILIEKPATNNFKHSSDFSPTAWNKWSSGVVVPIVTINQAIAPDGTLTADKIDFPDVLNASEVSHVGQLQTLPATNHNFSLYLKGAIGGERLYIYRQGQADDKEIILTTEWQRFDLTFLSGGISTFHIFGIDLRGVPLQQTGNTAQTIYAWGAQSEEGSFPTSYIKTEASTQSRDTDELFYLFGAGNFPQNFTCSCGITPVTDGANYEDGLGLWGTEDSRGISNEIRAITDTSYGFDGLAFHLDKNDFEKDVLGKFTFSLWQEGGNIRATIVKDNVTKLDATIPGTLVDHSSTGNFQVGGWNATYFSANYRNINVPSNIFSIQEALDYHKVQLTDKTDDFTLEDPTDGISLESPY